jgi:hypothetical protein
VWHDPKYPGAEGLCYLDFSDALGEVFARRPVGNEQEGRQMSRLTPRTHRANAGGAGAGHSLPGAGSDLSGEVRPGVGDHLVVPVAAVPAVLADPGEHREPLVGGVDFGVVVESEDDGEVAEQAVTDRYVHFASPSAPGSAHHKRDTCDGEATGVESQAAEVVSLRERLAGERVWLSWLVGVCVDEDWPTVRTAIETRLAAEETTP